MLEHLRARNLGLIEDAELNPGRGLTVVTGETGAGKTLLLGALRLLMGDAADSSVVGPFADAAQSDGLFLLEPVADAGDESEIAVSRVVPKNGRSRAYRDGVIVSADALSTELGDQVEIVGQHDQLRLRRASYVLSLVDSNLSSDGRELLEAYRKSWADLNVLLEEKATMGSSSHELARELDLLKHQTSEISRAALEPGEDESLERDSLRLRNASEIRDHLGTAADIVDQLGELSGELVSHLRKVGALDTGAADLAQQAETLSISISELSRDLSSNADDLVDDPEVLASIDDRLNLMGDLKRKYGKTVEEIIEFGREAANRLEKAEQLLSRSEVIDREIDQATSRATQAAASLTEARRSSANAIAKAARSHLTEVGLESSTLEIDIEPVELNSTGADRAKILFSSHDQLEAGPISKVASGGELSRLILAVSLATGSAHHATLVFDEVDTGVGGTTALSMGRKLAELSASKQVLCVTHLPQVAAFADTHYVVARDADRAQIRLVEGADRLEELSRMIAGLPESDRGQQAAKELLELSGK